MIRITINPEWNFKEMVDNIEAIKSQTREIIASFSYFQKKEEIEFKRELKKQIFALKFEYWKCERLLEYIYDDFTLEELERLK